MQLFLIRHPPPAIGDGICYGASDLPLAGDAELAAAELRIQLPRSEEAPVPLYSSPLRRCRALAAALHPEPIVDARLTEISFGDWELRPWDEIGRDAVATWAADPFGFTPPGGENARRVLERALDFLASVLAAGPAAAIVVTHSGVIRLLAGHLQGLPENDWLRLRFRFSGVSAFDVRSLAPGGGRVLFLDR